MVELLIVLGIIAVLAAILLPSLSRARVQARRAVCMANQRSLAQGVQTFATEHHGFGQLIAFHSAKDGPLHPYLPGRYDYERRSIAFGGGAGSAQRPPLSPWPIAYSDHIGAPGLRSEDLFLSGRWTGEDVGTLNGLKAIQKDVQAKRKVGVLQCPADRELIGGVHGAGGTFAAISYSINMDIFGEDRTGHQNDEFPPGALWAWRNRGSNGRRLSGRLDRVVDPAGVLMFVDGGGIEDRQSYGSGPHVRILDFFSAWGPRFSDTVENNRQLLPKRRHSPKGGLVGVHVDGHADYIRPVQWRMSRGVRIPNHYVPNPRLSPYGLGPTEDVGAVSQRR